MTLDCFIRLADLTKLTGLSEATLRRKEKAGHFPARVRLGPNAVAWRESEVAAWMREPQDYRVTLA
ncbi:helix-turn-helix transcriptional regulator [Novosphingobium sp.]|uniref:helix-turn-helix transcriptional regulator n=1 Tax=Novosphingobium sp. TaxID=1874826 RepID=UPI002FDC8E94